MSHLVAAGARVGEEVRVLLELGDEPFNEWLAVLHGGEIRLVTKLRRGLLIDVVAPSHLQDIVGVDGRSGWKPTVDLGNQVGLAKRMAYVRI